MQEDDQNFSMLLIEGDFRHSHQTDDCNKSSHHIVEVEGVFKSPFNLEGLLSKDIEKLIEHFLHRLDFCIQDLEKQMQVVLNEEMLTSYMGLHTGLLKLRAVFFTAQDLFCADFDRQDFVAKNLHIDQAVMKHLSKETLCVKYLTFMISFFERVISEQINPLLEAYLQSRKSDLEERNMLMLKSRLLVKIVERCAYNIQFGLYQQPDDVIAKSEAAFHIDKQPWIQKMVAAADEVHRRERGHNEEVQEDGQKPARVRGSGEQV